MYEHWTVPNKILQESNIITQFYGTQEGETKTNSVSFHELFATCVMKNFIVHAHTADRPT